MGPRFPPALRKEFNERGIFALQGYGTADLGSIAYESEAIEGMILDEGVIVEIVRPGTGDPVPEGEVGEVVVTTFNKAYPLVRFGTGDLSAVLPGISPCGRTNTRIKGWMGRADQRTKVKGMFVDPEQVIEVTAARTERTIVFHFRDPGKGFDRTDLSHAAKTPNPGDVMASVEERAASGLRPGGFGMLIVRHIVDELVYNEPGNEVLMIKHLK